MLKYPKKEKVEASAHFPPVSFSLTFLDVFVRLVPSKYDNPPITSLHQRLVYKKLVAAIVSD